MPDLSRKFTDRKLKQLYGHILNHYRSFANRPYLTVDDMYRKMYKAVVYTLESDESKSPLRFMDQAEKVKAYAAFEIIFRSLPKYKELNPDERDHFNPPRPKFDDSFKITINQYNYYHCHDSSIFNWIILNSLITHSLDHNHHHSGGSCCWPSNHHGHGSSTDENFIKLLAILFLITLAFIAIVLAFIALCYMLNELANSIERFYFNEGWLKGALMLAISIAFSSGSTLLTLSLGAAPLMAIAIAAGFNPVGVLIAGAVLLGIIGAGIGCLAMSLLYDSINKSFHKESLDPSDPERFRLTASEEKFLREKKKLEPLAIKCAMVALRAEIAKELQSEDSIPSFFSRFFKSENKKVQDLLIKLRFLRQGDLNIVDVGDMTFDCRMSDLSYVPTPTYLPTPEHEPHSEFYPSAPQYIY